MSLTAFPGGAQNSGHGVRQTALAVDAGGGVAGAAAAPATLRQTYCSPSCTSFDDQGAGKRLEPLRRKPIKSLLLNYNRKVLSYSRISKDSACTKGLKTSIRHGNNGIGLIIEKPI